jgi:hypothetical protein
LSEVAAEELTRGAQQRRDDVEVVHHVGGDDDVERSRGWGFLRRVDDVPVPVHVPVPVPRRPRIHTEECVDIGVVPEVDARDARFHAAAPSRVVVVVVVVVGIQGRSIRANVELEFKGVRWS